MDDVMEIVKKCKDC
jgi:hypothetical protein